MQRFGSDGAIAEIASTWPRRKVRCWCGRTAILASDPWALLDVIKDVLNGALRQILHLH